MEDFQEIYYVEDEHFGEYTDDEADILTESESDDPIENGEDDENIEPIEQFSKCNDYFSYNNKTKDAICKIKKCTQKISKNHHGNKLRHLRAKHRSIYNAIINRRKLKRVDPIATHMKTSLFEKKNLISACVEIVTKNGRPLCFVDDSGFRKILNPLLDEIKHRTGERSVINPEIIKSAIACDKETINSRIKHEIKNKLISVMVDIASKHGISILGVNIRYCFEGNLKVATIGMRPITTKHTGQNLKDLITEIFKEFDISTRQVYTFTIDNARNLNKTCQLMNISEENHEYGDDEAESSANHEYFAYILSELEEEYTKVFVNVIPCAAHTLQLAINDAIKEGEYNGTISLARRITKMLRKPSIVPLLRSRKLKQAIIDCNTRWNTIYLMVNYTNILFSVHVQILNRNSFCEKLFHNRSHD